MGAGFGPPVSRWPELSNTPSVMDEVRNPPCTQEGKGTDEDCFKDNRATLHLHGGTSPYISDGTPHQWIAPAVEDTPWPQGESVGNVPDMAPVAGVPDCRNTNDGCMTFYYTNQQSARMMFYHDHASGTTRLNVYLGEAAGYLISDDTEKALLTPDGTGKTTIPVDQIPLIIQDRTFVPDTAQLSWQDPTWDAARWGGHGNFWYHHVYMPAQNPGDPSGMSAYGRWMYGPWFWPPATPPYGPIPNPYYQMNPKADPPFSQPLAADKQCDLNVPETWQYETDPFCEPQLIPGTPNISAGMEQFNDTPLVNGTAYPTLEVEPKAYRLRVLNAANDRFWNLQWYIPDPRTGTESEVALNPNELAAAQTDINVFPTPDTNFSPAGPSWIQIGTEGGFLPAPVVVPNQPTTWITDPTRFDVGLVDKHSLLLGPAERADVIVDFSGHRNKTLILYNDAPAAFPARVASYDYYTGAPDMSPNGAPTILPGYGPNTRTIMRVHVKDTTPAAAFNLTRLKNAFKHNANGTGVFESGQHPIIVGQAAYNSAYGTNFAASSYCNGGNTTTLCDGFARISDQGGTMFGFNTLLGPNAKMQIKLEPKGMHDEMNSAAFDEFGRMTANLGLENVPATPGLANITLYPYINPPTEMFNATNLPGANLEVTPITSATDGTQIWKITHNGVDTHPIHFHLYDVQVLNRVAWDNNVKAPDLTELGWKDTVRISPLEDTIVAIRPVIPDLPWELPNAIRYLNPATEAGSHMGFNPITPAGQNVPITNQLVNFGWEYVWHCHILSHEEMDMMRPMSVAVPPSVPIGLSYSLNEGGYVVLNWTDNSIAETSYQVQKSADGTLWTDVGTPIQSPLDQANGTGPRSMTDPSATPGSYYRVIANNTVGLGGGYGAVNAQSVSDSLAVVASPIIPTDPNTVVAVQVAAQIQVTFNAPSDNESGFVVQRKVGAGAFVSYTTLAANVTTFADAAVSVGNTYQYQVAALNGTEQSAYAASNNVVVVGPVAVPSNQTAVLTNATTVMVSFRDNANNETGYIVQRAINGGAWTTLASPAQPGVAAGTGTTVNYVDSPVAPDIRIQYRIAAVNSAYQSAFVTTNLVVTAPSRPDPVANTAVRVATSQSARYTVTWSDQSAYETGFTIQRATNAAFTTGVVTVQVGPNVQTYTTGNVNRNTPFYFRVWAQNAAGISEIVNATPFPRATPIP